MEDRVYCASSFLTYRTIIDTSKCFSNKYPLNIKEIPENRDPVYNSDDLYASLKRQVEELSKTKKVALCLSGGIDSAILAKFLPKETLTYTFKCVVPGIEVTDETPMAKKYAEECNVKNKVVEVYWEDFEKYAPILMKHKGAPIHSIEVQIYKAALQAKKDGVEVLIFGESADCLYGGQSMLFSKDWTYGEFIDRYSYVRPYYALKNYCLEFEPYKAAVKENGYIDVAKFMGTTFFKESINSYTNACETAGVECSMPFANTELKAELDYNKIKEGNIKYLVREVFTKLYPNFEMPPKVPMPRPMNEWFKDWKGPTRDEFWPNFTDNMTGDQKWVVWALERFLDIIDE